MARASRAPKEKKDGGAVEEKSTPDTAALQKTKKGGKGGKNKKATNKEKDQEDVKDVKDVKGKEEAEPAACKIKYVLRRSESATLAHSQSKAGQIHSPNSS